MYIHIYMPTLHTYVCPVDTWFKEQKVYLRMHTILNLNNYVCRF